MRYTAMIVGFLLATLTQVGAAEIGQSDYVEFSVQGLTRTKMFYSAVFGWTFADYGPTYASFDDGKIGGGFTTDGTPNPGGPLMVFYVANIEAALQSVKRAGWHRPEAAVCLPRWATLPLPRSRRLRSRRLVAEVRTIQFDETLSDGRTEMWSL
jgi:predicted enzyme related to lactoylglutathione lyase